MIATASLALLVPAAGLWPQGGSETIAPVSLPRDPAQMVFHPFRDQAGQPQVQGVRAAGAADFDGNGMPDLWFLAGTGPRLGEVSVQMARGASVGRFRPWHVEPGAAHLWTDGATLHLGAEAQDRVLLVDPAGTGIDMLHFVPALSGDPRTGPGAAFWVARFLPLVVQDQGIFEIETRDRGAVVDDVVLLIDRGNGVTEVRKLELDYRFGPVVTATVSLQVPVPLAKLRLLDLDADGRTDFAVEVPGLGAVACRDAGGWFEFAAAVPSFGVPVVDVFAGPLQSSENGSVEAFGLLHGDRAHLSWLQPQGPASGLLTVPSAAVPLAAAAVLDGDPAGVVTLLSADGRRIHGHAFSPATRAFLALTPEPAADPALYSGPGATGLAAFCVDVDGDGDRDLVAAHPDGAGWLTLRNDRASLAPAVQVVHRGPVIPETGWFWEQFVVTLPAGLDPRAELEVAVYMEHPGTLASALWDRRIYPVNPVTRRAVVDVFMQTIPANVLAMHAYPAAYQWPFAFTAGGNTQISFHAKGPAHPTVSGSPRRFESHLRFHNAGGEGNKSAQGVRWERRAAPPLPRGDDELLPWQ